MTTHAKCPECWKEAELAFADCRDEYWVECCWGSPEKPTEAEAWRAWDTVVGAYWREKAEHDALEERAQKLMKALEKEQNMAKKAKRPVEPYHIIDNDGWNPTSLSKLWIAKREAKQQDKELPQCAPHRVYKLVTLEEAAVIRAARKATEQWKKHGWRTKVGDTSVVVDVMNALSDAVEASRG